MFEFRRNLNGQNRETYVNLPAKKNEAYAIGEALKIDGGFATKCGATEKPTHICGTTQKAEAGDASVACYPIFESYEFKVSVNGDPKSLKVGDKVTIHTDGLQVTTTTASGVAEIVAKEDKKVIVKFK